MSTDLATSRLIVHEAARIVDDPEATLKEKIIYASMAKKHATDSCYEV